MEEVKKKNEEIALNTKKIFKDTLRELNIDCVDGIDMVQREGMASDEILAYSEKNSFNLIIIGTSGHSAIEELFLGSTAKKIINTVLENNWERVSASPVSHLGYVAAAYMETACFQIVILAKNDKFKEKLEKNLLRYSSFFIINYVKSVDKIPKNSPAYNKKFVNNKTTVYVCTGTVCSEPISSFEKMEKWIEKNTNLSFK